MTLAQSHHGLIQSNPRFVPFLKKNKTRFIFEPARFRLHQDVHWKGIGQCHLPCRYSDGEGHPRLLPTYGPQGEVSLNCHIWLRYDEYSKKKKKKFWSDKTILIIYSKWVQKGAQFKWRHISDSKKCGMSTTWGMMASSSGMWKNRWRLWWKCIFFFFEDANLTQSPIQLYLSAIQFVTCRGSPSGGDTPRLV